METEFHVHDIVALLEDVPTKHFEDGRPLTLRRGQIGTVVITHNGGSYEIEFADRDGRTFAMLPLSADKLMVLHDLPEYVVA